MAMAVAPPVSAIRPEEGVMNTLPIPTQNGAETAGGTDGTEESAYKPDLSNEVAMLSTKLINAINHQTNLDDSLQATRHELDWAKQEVKRLTAEKQSLDDAIAQGVLVKKSEVDKTIAELRAQLAIEKMNRERAETSRKATEAELESLTTSLFEEANKMVEAAKKETKDVEKRNSQLKNQLNDQEAMLKSQQEQLHEMQTHLDQAEASARESGSTPNTPITSAANPAFDAPHGLSPNKLPPSANTPPDHPLHFSQLITPILRTDVSSYLDFAELLTWARRASPHSRSASGNVASSSSTNLTSAALTMSATNSSPSLPGAFAFGSSSANSSPNSNTFNGGYAFNPPLKESKFYKRSLIEDIEPTLRLDLAPGLSFLSRRTVNSALLNGTLSIEPFNPPTKFYSPIFACSLCGEARKTEPYPRRHRFRTSEQEDASKYPLCEFCLGRVRSAADFVSFLRMVKDGHWRCDSEEEERKAWEEATRLRERMFWARIGGGVVPASILERQREGTGVEWEIDSEGRVDKARWSGLLKGTTVPDGIREVETDVLGAEEKGDDDEDDDGGEAEEGVARAIVNMSSQAATSAMPELKHQETRDSDFHTPEQETPPDAPENPAQSNVSDSEKDQTEASAQFHAESKTNEEEDRPSSPPPPADPPATESSQTEHADPEPQPETAKTDSRPSTARSATPTSRPSSPTKISSRPSSPNKSSNVLARVRAMEAKGSS